jgi:putative glutamine amidotransferase
LKPKIYVPDYKGYATPFLPTFAVTPNIKEADCLLLTGGEDIDPRNYGEQPGRYTYYRAERDRYEIEAFNVAQSKGIPTLGICRGAQMLCALAGGKLVQDVTGHGSSHPIETKDGDTLRMTSLHHQMMRPEGTEHTMIAWASKPLSKHYLNGKDEEIYGHALEKEPEIVYFSKIKGLGIQGHPEMLPAGHETVDYCNRLVKEFLLGEQDAPKNFIIH